MAQEVKPPRKGDAATEASTGLKKEIDYNDLPLKVRNSLEQVHKIKRPTIKKIYRLTDTLYREVIVDHNVGDIFIDNQGIIIVRE